MLTCIGMAVSRSNSIVWTLSITGAIFFFAISYKKNWSSFQMNTVFEHWLHISASLSLDTESSRTFQVKTFICQEFLWHPVLFHISTKKKVSWRRAFLLKTSNIPRTVFSAWCPSVGHFPELRNRKCRASTCIGSLKICFGASSGRWTLLGI